MPKDRSHRDGVPVCLYTDGFSNAVLEYTEKLRGEGWVFLKYIEETSATTACFKKNGTTIGVVADYACAEIRIQFNI